MKTFEWSALFATGLEDVDTQHRRLIELVNALSEDIESGAPERIDTTLTALAEYTVYHFGCEERLMVEHGVDARYAERHRATHQKFVAQVQAWMATREANGQLSPRQLLDYLANWLIFHILGDDQSMGRQIAAIHQGVVAAEALASDKASDDPRTEVLLGALRRLYADLVERNDRLVSAQQDLTELNATLEARVRQRTAELTEANAQIKAEQQRVIEAEKMASLGRLVAGFAHEVNTPVGVAVGAISQASVVVDEFAQLLAQDEVSEADITERLQLLKESNGLAMANLKRAAGLVTSFKRTAVDQSSDQSRNFALAEVIDDAVHNLRPMFKHSDIQFDVRCPEALDLYGHPGALAQVLTNLCTNAFIHGFADGKKSGRVSISARRDADDVELCFADNGAGMDETSVRKAFEPFYTTRRDHGGSGLGLYIVYNLVTHELGGSITCHSTPTTGTEFLIRFPAQAAILARTSS